MVLGFEFFASILPTEKPLSFYCCTFLKTFYSILKTFPKKYIKAVISTSKHIMVSDSERPVEGGVDSVGLELCCDSHAY